MAIADRMAILDAGAVRQLAQPQAINETPNCRYVAALVGTPSMNFVTGVVCDGSFAPTGWRGGILRRSAQRWTGNRWRPASGQSTSASVKPALTAESTA